MLKSLSFLLCLLSVTSAMGEVESNGRLAKIMLLPTVATVGQRASIMVYPEKFSGDIPLDTIVKAKFENQDVSLERFSDDLWRFKTAPLLEVKTYTFTADIFIEDKKQAGKTRKEIDLLSKEITQIEFQIQEETDPVVLQRIIAERDEKTGDKEDLLDLLELLRTYVGSEAFTFIPNSTAIINY